MERYVKLSQILSEQELCYLEDALKDFNPSYLTRGELLQALKDEITMARRWRHQFGKTQR